MTRELPVRVVVTGSVTGSREWTDHQVVRRVLLTAIRRLGVLVVVHGGQGRRDRVTGRAVRGLDVIADDVARELGMRTDPCPADWARFRRGGGPIRNRAMVDSDPAPVWCLGFPLPGSVGTWDCMSYALSRGLRVFNCSDGELLEVCTDDDGQARGPGFGGVARNQGTSRGSHRRGGARGRQGQDALW